MNYCSLEEAWGINTSAKGCNVHLQHKKKFEKDNPIHSPNINYECSFNEESKNKNTLTGYTGKTLTNYQDSNSKNYNLLNKKNNEDLDLYSFIKSLNIDEATKEILKNKISNAINSVKYEVPENNGDIRENFSSRYYKSNGLENRNVDILFLILLGLFIIFILDKK
jgi:hypothetical protein